MCHLLLFELDTLGRLWSAVPSRCRQNGFKYVQHRLLHQSRLGRLSTQRPFAVVKRCPANTANHSYSDYVAGVFVVLEVLQSQRCHCRCFTCSVHHLLQVSNLFDCELFSARDFVLTLIPVCTLQQSAAFFFVQHFASASTASAYCLVRRWRAPHIR